MIDIFYTVAPASLDIADGLMQAGATGARLTFSFGTPELQLARARMLKLTAQNLDISFQVMADLGGGGVRIGEILIDGASDFSVAEGESISIANTTLVSEKALPIPDGELYSQLAPGDTLIVGDNSAVFEVTERMQAKSRFAATVEGCRSLSVPQHAVQPSCLTEKDMQDLAHIISHSEAYDCIALSFVSSAADVLQVRAMLDAAESAQKLIAKIETREGVNNIESICAVADEVMVARGDLAIMMPWQEMPKAVEHIVGACKKTKTPYIMATQVAESMMHGHTMTRAEMTDLWHWREQGMAGVLLSRETAWGDHPVKVVEAVKTLCDVE